VPLIGQCSLLFGGSAEPPTLLGWYRCPQQVFSSRQPQAEYRPRAGFVLADALGRKVATLGAGEVVGDGESQTSAPAFAGAGLLGPVEAVEDARQVLRGNTDYVALALCARRQSDG
jgi:hypothetical protein